ncbi:MULTISPECIES: hypothetical protein [unclassified Streptomyces]|uniref:hypothetical protein n=1 Tax=unclassified Streptomyces TaxID=2593676 RepID=UPI00382BEDE4
MSASILERTARTRRSRTRSRTVNSRPALVISTLKPHQYDLRPACASLICPDCETWVPITGLQTKKPKLVPHDTGRAGKAPAVRCRLGSNRLIAVDVTVKKWQQRLEDGHAETGHRRSARQFYKPMLAPAAPVARIKAEVTPETARQSYLAHREGCTRCVGGKHRRHCQDGATLARRYVLALQNEPARRETRAEQERQERRAERKRTAPAVRKAQWAERGGAAVEAANNRCANRAPGMVSTFRGPQVPVAPRDIEAHERRQAELGKQYVRRTPAV